MLSNALTYCPVTLFINSLLKERGNCLWLCGSECLLQSCTSEEPGWKTEPLLTGPGKVPDAVCAGVVSSIGSSLVFVCDVAMVFYGRFAAYLTTPIGTQESVEENTDGSRRFRKVPPWSLALVLCPDGIKPAEAETTQPSHTESHLGCLCVKKIMGRERRFKDKEFILSFLSP